MANKMTIWFDLDGTLANLYAVEGWLDMLRSHDPTPYLKAEPMLHFSSFARQLNALQRKGAKLGIISWLSKNSNESFDNAVMEEKLQWLKKHLSSVAWDEIHIVPYGTNKAASCGVNNSNFILFDDEEQNRKTWEKFGGFSYSPTEITMTLSMLNRRLGTWAAKHHRGSEQLQ